MADVVFGATQAGVGYPAATQKIAESVEGKPHRQADSEGDRRFSPGISIEQRSITAQDMAPQAESTLPAESVCARRITLRLRLIDAVLKFLSIQTSHPGFPMLTGDFDWMHQGSSMTVAFPSMGIEQLSNALAYFMSKEQSEDQTIGCKVSVGELGDQIFAYECQGEVFFTIRLITVNETVEMLCPVNYLFLPRGCDTATGLNTSSRAVLHWLWGRLNSESLTPPELTCIANEIHCLPALAENAELFGAMAYRYNFLSRQLNQGVSNSPVAPEERVSREMPLDESVAPQTTITRQLSVIAGEAMAEYDPEDSLVNADRRHIDGLSFFKLCDEIVLFSDKASTIKRDINTVPDLGFSTIKGIFPEPDKGNTVLRIATKDITGVKQKKAAKAKGKKGKKSSSGMQPGRYGIAGALAGLARGVAKLEARNTHGTAFGELFSEKTAGLIADFIGTEASLRIITHHFPHCPYLGKAQCFHGANNLNISYERMVEYVRELMPTILDDIRSEMSVDKRYKTDAIISALLLKYLVYMSAKDEGFSSLLARVAKHIQSECKAIKCVDGQSVPESEWILPRTLLIVLFSPKIKDITFSRQSQGIIIDTLSCIMAVSLRQGVYEITAAIISLLPLLESHIKSADPQTKKNLAIQIQQFFFTMQYYVENSVDGSTEQFYAAQAIEDNGEVNEKLPGQFTSPLAGYSEQIESARSAARKILEKEKASFFALQDEVNEARKNAREQQAKIRREQAEARARKQQRTSPPSEQEGGEHPDENKASETIFTMETAPVSTTAVAALEPEQEPWEKELGKAVKSYREGFNTEAHKHRSEAIGKAGSAINKAYIYTDCGYARLAKSRDTILLLSTLAKNCNDYRGELGRIDKRLLRELGNTILLPGEGSQRLKRGELPSARDLGVLERALPTPEALLSATEALNETIGMYQKAVQLMNNCCPADVQEHGSFMLKLIESDLNQFHEDKEMILATKVNLFEAMNIRTGILRRLGLYGGRCVEKGRGEGLNQPPPLQKSVYRETQERLEKSTLEFHTLYSGSDSSDKLKMLMDAIKKLKNKKD